MNREPEVRRFRLIDSDSVRERTHTLFACEYQGMIETAILFRFDGQCRAFLNRCVHMPFRLDCEKTDVFSASRDHLKCSMHGIIYDPVTGESLSPTMCTGDKLTPITVVEEDGNIWLEDSQVDTVLNGYVAGNG